MSCSKGLAGAAICHSSSIRLHEETIAVNVDKLELTPDPFKVKRTSGMQSRDEDDVVYQGFIITAEVNPNDALGVDAIGLGPFPFAARVASSNEVVVEMPLIKYSERGGHDDLIRKKLEEKHQAGKVKYPDEIVDAMDDARKSFEQRSGNYNTIMKKQVNLVFPDTVKLSGKVLKIHEGKKKEMLKTEGYTVFDDIQKLNRGKVEETVMPTDPAKPHKTEKVRIYKVYAASHLHWRVADLNQPKKYKGASNPATSAETEAASELLG